MSKTGTWTRGLALAAALCGALLAAGAVRAQDGREPADLAAALADPPGRVGRVSALIGAVDLSQGAGAPWELARVNQPVTGQTALFAPPGSQAEVRIGSTSVRLDADTQAVFSQLDDHGVAIEVAQGTVRARVRNLPTGDAFSLAADGVRAMAEQPGDYRVNYDADNRAYTVRSLAGELRLVTPAGSYRVEAGQEIVVEDGGERVRLRPLGEADAFDAWAEARDRQQDALASTRYVSPETTGIEALDEHGRWDVTDEYGAVWYPRSLPLGWAPYRHGHWAHVHPWGWTWVDDAPWGFAPFHYGRWAVIGGHWGWVPGPLVARPVWAPALVGYVGGSRLSVGIGIGAPVGWFPLAPWELYHPPYRYSQRHWDHVNWRKKHGGKHRDHDDWRGKHRRDRDDWRDGDWRDDDERGDRRMRHHRGGEPGYRFAKRPDALTVVSADSFRRSRPVAGERLALDAAQIAQLAPFSPGLRLPDVTPRLGNPAAAFGGRPAVEPALRLPAPLPHGLRQRDHDGPRWRGAPRERDGGERRMVARPPVFERDGDGRRDGRDGDGRRDGLVGDGRRDGDHIVRRIEPGGGARIDAPVQRRARPDRDPLQVLRPQAPSVVRPVLPSAPPRRAERPAPPLRAVAPDRRMQAAPLRPVPTPGRALVPGRPVQGPPAGANLVQPPLRTVPALVPRQAQPSQPALRRMAPPPRSGAGIVRGTERGGRMQAPRGAHRQR